MDIIGDSSSEKELNPFMGSPEISMDPTIINSSDSAAASCMITLELTIPETPGEYYFNTEELAKDGPALIATSSNGSEGCNVSLACPSSSSSQTSDESCNKSSAIGRKRNYLYQLDPRQENNEQRQMQIDRAKRLKQFHEKKKKASQVDPEAISKTLEILECLESVCETMISASSATDIVHATKKMDSLINEIRSELNS